MKILSELITIHNCNLKLYYDDGRDIDLCKKIYGVKLIYPLTENLFTSVRNFSNTNLARPRSLPPKDEIESSHIRLLCCPRAPAFTCGEFDCCIK